MLDGVEIYQMWDINVKIDRCIERNDDIFFHEKKLEKKLTKNYLSIHAQGQIMIVGWNKTRLDYITIDLFYGKNWVFSIDVNECQ